MPNMKAEIGIPCPHCGHSFRQTLHWLMSHRGEEVACTSCGQSFPVESLGSLDDIIRSMRDSAHQFRRTNPKE